MSISFRALQKGECEPQVLQIRESQLMRDLTSHLNMYHSVSKYGLCVRRLGNKAKKNACPCGAFIQGGETNNKHVASGFENGPAACVVQMVTVSAFANTIEPNQRLFNKNNFTIISSLMTADRLIGNSGYSQGMLKVPYYLHLLITHTAPGIALSSEHTTLEGKPEVPCSQYF